MEDDIFDQVASRRKDPFDEVESDRIGDKVFDEVEKELPSLVRSYVKEQTKKIKTLSPKDISNLVDAAISAIPKPKLERVIERTETIKVVPQKDTKKYAQESELKDLKEKIEKLEKLLKDKDREVAVQYIGTMIPNYSGKDGKVLSIVNGQLTWVEASGASSDEVYTATNVTTRRTLNADDTSLDELADLVGTLIADFKAIGLIQ